MAMLEPNPEVVENIVGKLKTNGMFDEMRRKCLADIDTKVSLYLIKYVFASNDSLHLTMQTKINF